MEITKEDVLELMEKFENSSASKMILKIENTSLELEKPTAQVCAMPAPAGGTPVASETTPGAFPADLVQTAPAATELTKPSEPKGTPVKAPLAGTFYRASKPDAEPFVKKGDTVKKGDVVGIIEAMKTMNEIAAPVSGRIAFINTDNGEFAQYGDELMVITEE